MNFHLNPNCVDPEMVPVRDISTDLSDSILYLRLLYIMSGETVSQKAFSALPSEERVK